jgi:hypothetical protein
MAITFPGGDPDAIVECTRRLAADVQRLAATGGPTTEDLRNAPVLDWWLPTRRQVFSMIGVVSGHPTIGDRHTALTTEIFAFDAAAGWARSWSRFYALGRSASLFDRRTQ